MRELYLRIAKAVVGGTFEKEEFPPDLSRKLFPPKKGCKHCGGRKSAWRDPQEVLALSEPAHLADKIGRKGFCAGCLQELSQTYAALSKLPYLTSEEKKKVKVFVRVGPFQLGRKALGWLILAGMGFLFVIVNL